MNNLKEVTKIMGHIDANDVVFIAVALGVKNSVLWPDDKDFQKQKKIKIFTTQDFAKRFLRNI